MILAKCCKMFKFWQQQFFAHKFLLRSQCTPSMFCKKISYFFIIGRDTFRTFECVRTHAMWWCAMGKHNLKSNMPTVGDCQCVSELCESTYWVCANHDVHFKNIVQLATCFMWTMLHFRAHSKWFFKIVDQCEYIKGMWKSRIYN